MSQKLQSILIIIRALRKINLLETLRFRIYSPACIRNYSILNCVCPDSTAQAQAAPTMCGLLLPESIFLTARLVSSLTL